MRLYIQVIFYFWDWENDSVMRNKYDSWRNKSETYNEAKGFLILWNAIK